MEYFERFREVFRKIQKNCKNTTAIIIRIFGKTAGKQGCKLRETLPYFYGNIAALGIILQNFRELKKILEKTPGDFEKVVKKFY